jgi:CheY-like chemotaxis protein
MEERYALVGMHDEGNRALFTRLLERNGYNIVTSNNPNHMVQLARGGSWNLVVMDSNYSTNGHDPGFGPAVDICNAYAERHSLEQGVLEVDAISSAYEGDSPRNIKNVPDCTRLTLFGKADFRDRLMETL